MKAMILTSFLSILATSATAMPQIECLTDPQRGDVCRVLAGATCEKGGPMGYVDPFTNLKTQFDPRYRTPLGWAFNAPPGWKLIPGTGWAQNLVYKKKAKIIVAGISDTQLVCQWKCEPARSRDSYVRGYCGAKATRVQ
jgi:hypothetical protein